MKRGILCCLAAGLLLLLSGCGARESVQVPELLEPVGVRTDSAVVTRGDLYATKAYEGALTARGVELSFEIDGTLAHVDIYPGKWVQQGEVLLTIDQTDLKKQLDDLTERISYLDEHGAIEDEIARLEIEKLRLTLEWVSAQGSQQQIDLAALDVEQAELDLLSAQQNRAIDRSALQREYDELAVDYGKNTITAPFSGHVFYENALLEGSYVRAYQPVVYMADPADLSLIVTQYLTDREIANNKVYALIDGQRYDVVYDPLTRDEMTALILSGQSLTSRFRVVMPEGGEEAGHAGQYGVLCMETGLVEDVLMIPSGAVLASGSGKYVYVIGEDGERVRRDVQTGRSNGIDTVIVEGLEEGETVYVGE